ncbi:unnamed protein product [Orchesella dallaii]|uniref:Cytochrome P450 9e2 n=1 Tax=Orchesella dallaii TaxID=48710 RepID=A0ABP1Q3E0_9HEXA
MFFEYILLGITACLIYKLFLAKARKPKWWKEHGIPEIDPSPNFSSFLFEKKNPAEKDDFVYKAMGTKSFCGVLESGQPVIFLKDLNLIKKVFIKDFDHFSERPELLPIANKSLIFNKILGLLTGEQWKHVRTSLTPTFTTGKVRRMMEHFNSVGQEWFEMLSAKTTASPTGSAKVDITSCVNQYAVEVISKSVFGIQAGVMKDSNSLFGKKAADLTSMGTGITGLIKMVLVSKFPKLCSILGIEVLDTEALKFLSDILRHNLEARLRGELSNNDLQQLLVEARKGELKAMGSDELDDFEKESQLQNKGNSQSSMYLTDEIIVAQGISFFFGGISTITSFLTFLAYALAVHQDIQEKLRKEVSQIVKEDGTFDYDELAKLKYLDMVIYEVLRKYPGGFRVERLCTKTYHDPESGLFVPKNTVVVIPALAIHNDKDYYENPEELDPEHFSPEKKAERSPYSFLAFGSGPRNCIGMRFALIESKSAIAKLVHSFNIEPTEKTPIPMKARYVGIFPIPPNDLELKLTPVK